jgi:hypothetical protein
LGLGDILTFLQKHFNQILAYKNPAYEFEFIGYEKDDPRLTIDIDSKEVDTWKTLNEKRAEKGLDAIDLAKVKNPADLPMNVQAVQLFQSQQGMSGMGGGDPFDGEGFDGENADGGEAVGEPESAENEGDGAGPEGEAGGGGWGGLEAQHSGGQVEKSLGGRVRIVI